MLIGAAIGGTAPKAWRGDDSLRMQAVGEAAEMVAFAPARRMHRE
jgi:hypothetical protein